MPWPRCDLDASWERRRQATRPGRCARARCGGSIVGGRTVVLAAIRSRYTSAGSPVTLLKTGEG